MKDYELLEKQAEMMRMAEKHGIDDWRKLVKVVVQLPNGDTCYQTLVCKDYMGYSGSHPKYALGVVEGKGVFEGDEVYFPDGRKVKATKSWGRWSDFDEMSWNQPAPKTVQVELLVEDAEFVTKIISVTTNLSRIIDACRKALESIK